MITALSQDHDHFTP